MEYFSVFPLLNNRKADQTALLLQLISKVDDLAQDRIRRADFESLERKFDLKIGELEGRSYSKNEVDLMRKAADDDRHDLRQALDELRQQSLTSTQRLISQWGGIIGIATGLVVLWSYFHH